MYTAKEHTEKKLKYNVYHYCDTPYKNLALAIVKQATDDYKSVCRRMKRNRVDRNIYKDEIRRLELFFYSDWFILLTDGKIKSDYLIEMLREECGVNDIG